MIDEAKTRSLFGAVVAKLANPGEGEFVSAKNFYGAGLSAGLDMRKADPERRAVTLRAINESFEKLPLPDKYRALTSVVKTLMGFGATNAASAADILYGFGFAWDGDNVVPAGVLDERDRSFLPPTSADDLGKAVDRLSRGDESGAISAACGAVDLATGAAYQKLGLGDPGRVAFSAKVNTALAAARVFEDMRAEFQAIGMDEKDAEETVDFLRRATNDASQALQILRRRMGDVHGSHPALKSTAYDCIKLASAICALFEGRL